MGEASKACHLSDDNWRPHTFSFFVLSSPRWSDHSLLSGRPSQQRPLAWSSWWRCRVSPGQRPPPHPSRWWRDPDRHCPYGDQPGKSPFFQPSFRARTLRLLPRGPHRHSSYRTPQCQRWSSEELDRWRKSDATAACNGGWQWASSPLVNSRP